MLKKVFTTEELIQNAVIMEKHNDHEDVGLINTMCGYMGDDGFTIVTRTYRNSVYKDTTKQKILKDQGNRLTTSVLSKNNVRAKTSEGKQSQNDK